MREEYEVKPEQTKTGAYTVECPVCIKKDKLFYAMATTRQSCVVAVMAHMNEQHYGNNQ